MKLSRRIFPAVLAAVIVFLTLPFVIQGNSVDYSTESDALSDNESGTPDIWDGSTADGFESGTGSETDPYIIKTPEQLAFFECSVNSGTTYENKYIKLVNDIYLNDTDGMRWWDIECKNGTPLWANHSWMPIGNESHRFKGIFDGNGFEISGIYIYYYWMYPNNYVGLFGYSEGIIKNISINCSRIEGHSFIGAVCGYNGGMVINCCIIDSAIIGNSKVMTNVGGVCGQNSGTVIYSYSKGSSISGDENVGGVCGYNTGTVAYCFNIYSSDDTSFGYSYSGLVMGDIFVGGVCGFLEYGIITNSYNIGFVRGTKYVGGVCGTINSGSLSDCYNAGVIIGDCSVGGICGYTGDDNSGKSCTIKACYYLYGCAVDGDDIAHNGIGEDRTGLLSAYVSDTTAGLSKAQMQQQASFEGFDFDKNWKMPAENTAYKYPVLNMEHIHAFTNKVTAATCTEPGYTVRSCDCGYTITDRNIDSLGHNWSPVTYKWNGDNCTASRVCLNDSTHTETETVTGVYVKDKDASYTSNETGHLEARFTNTAFEKQLTAVGGIEKEGTLLHPSVSLRNTEFAVVPGRDFTTEIKATQIKGTGIYATLTFDRNVVMLKSYSAGSGTSVAVDDNSLFVTSESAPTDETVMISLTFTASEELSVGEYDFLACDENNASAFGKFRIYAMGDVNMDGDVNSSDALIVKQYAVKMTELTEAQLVYADVNSDGKVNSRDAQLISRYVEKNDVKLDDRICLSFINGSETVIRFVRRGGFLNWVPPLPYGYAWSESESTYVCPVYVGITEEKSYYARKVR